LKGTAKFIDFELRLKSGLFPEPGGLAN